MALSRKRQRELRRLRRDVEHLFDEQREAVEHASSVLREASRQAANYAREEVGPRVKDTFDDRVKPVFSRGVKTARSTASDARDRLTDDVLPSISRSLGSALASLEAARDPRVREAVKKVAAAGTKAGVVTMPKKNPGPGAFILIGLGVVAVAAVGYAAWQTLRADDELWIEDLGDPGAADIGDDDEESFA